MAEQHYTPGESLDDGPTHARAWAAQRLAHEFLPRPTAWPDWEREGFRVWVERAGPQSEFTPAEQPPEDDPPCPPSPQT